MVTWQKDRGEMFWWICLSAGLGLAFGLVVSLIWARWKIGRARDAERLAEKGQSDLSSLVGGLAHELKNPLSTITVNLQLLAEDFQRPQNERERHALVRLAVLGQESARLSKLLDEVLKFVRDPDLHRRDCDINQLLETMLDFYSPQARLAKLTFRHQLHPDPLVCSVDVDLLKQVLLNIFINAQQAMPDGGELIIRSSVDRDSAVIDITDTGPGISDGDKQKVFEVSFSTKLGGSGLGLPTAKRIVKAHQGKIEVQSTPGQGTNFRISLPLVS